MTRDVVRLRALAARRTPTRTLGLDRPRQAVSASSAGPIEPPEATINLKLDRRVKRLGKGGQGTVWQYTLASGQPDVAVKYADLGPDSGRNADILRRFVREVNCQTSLTHPNIVPVIDSDLSAADPYFVMPLATSTLSAELSMNPTGLHEEVALNYAVEILEAMSYAHQQKVLHRDLNPRNVLLYGSRACVTDFGLGRDLENDSSLTGINQFGGTPNYASPEQQRDFHSADYRSDVYSAGLILLELLVGLTRNRSAIPDRFRYVLARATAENPDERFSDAPEMLHELLLLRRSESPEDTVAVGRALLDQAATEDREHLAAYIKLLVDRSNDSRLYFEVLTETTAEILEHLLRLQSTLVADVVGNLALLLDGPLPMATRQKSSLFMQRLFFSTAPIQIKRAALKSVANLYLDDRGWFLRKRFIAVAEHAIGEPSLEAILASVISETLPAPLIEAVRTISGGDGFLKQFDLRH